MNADAAADALIARLGSRIVLALPLGLGKAAALANALYARARANPAFSLEILTALTLEVPKPKAPLEARFLGPIVERLYRDCPELDYATDLRAGNLPTNVRVVEFYFRPGANLGLPAAQRNYASLNYTHAAREMLARGVNVIGQMVARTPEVGGAPAAFSLSCNPDVTLDLLDAAQAAGAPLPLLVGEVNDALPFMPNGAVLPAAAFAHLIEDPACTRALFPVPNRPVSLADHAIALRVAMLVKDGGTLQIGIGSLGDAIAHAIAQRHTANATFRALAGALAQDGGPQPELDELPGGLYGCSEMFVEGFLRLREAGVLTRTVPGDVWMHGGFFLGSARFYDALRGLPERERRGIDMTRISFTNNLLGDELAKRRDRVHARFVNTAMMLTLLGAAVSDGLEDGRVVSGVGGQYNFVAMAHELAGARSILMVPATRVAGGVVSSNIVWNYGHTTIPRHLRDIAVTEYGVADLRGRSDRDVIVAMLNIADARFQDALKASAMAAGKLEPGYEIPERFRRNLPEVLERKLRGSGAIGALPWFPLGSDFTDVESTLAIVLGLLGDLRDDRRALAGLAWRGWRQRDPTQQARLAPLLERVGLDRPRSLQDRLLAALLSTLLVERVFASDRPIVTRSAAPAGRTP